MPCVYLCAYMTAAKSDFGHAFVGWTAGAHGERVTAAGLSPRPLPGGALTEVATVIPGGGQVYLDSDCLDNDGLRYHRWNVTIDEVARLTTHVNGERKKNVGHVGTSDHRTAHAMATGADVAGGPDYQLLWSNCASWALNALALVNDTVAGDVRAYRAVVNRPGKFHGDLPNAGPLAGA